MPRRTTLRLVLLLLAASVSGCGDGGETAEEPGKAAVAQSTPASSPTPEPTPMILEMGDGLKAEVMLPGEGEEVAEGGVPRLEMRLRTPGGELIWEGTFEFMVGTGQAIEGLDRAVRGMKTGEQRRIHIPWQLGFGEKKTPSVPPRQDLIVEATLVSISENGSE